MSPFFLPLFECTFGDSRHRGTDCGDFTTVIGTNDRIASLANISQGQVQSKGHSYTADARLCQYRCYPVRDMNNIPVTTFDSKTLLGFHGSKSVLDTNFDLVTRHPITLRSKLRHIFSALEYVYYFGKC